ncbi:arginine deiminase family protein [Paenibacillus motobuensis]|uniref:dimethylarginine dimethylaminohydrolase family protein n=1 Tax=Paenibacillus TaxID=44249 RepID=UPI00203C3833|nr:MULTISPECIES: arginine deiminase family protein [Paenibacillus]MCM3039599.1 arginine deiminase family protein [Paenibacillus lutimineralis]MCM3646703.1 arginine deiminase family protein [Paenibacillus motobuensis]
MKIVDSAHGGKGWVERGMYHQSDIGLIWSNCGVFSETDELKHVLLHRPGQEIENIRDHNEVLWTEILDSKRAREQHDNMAEIYKQNNVIVDYIDAEDLSNNYPNLYFCRDLFTMTPQGAIISRLASKVRAGEELLAAKKMMQLDIPIIATAHGDMYLEGPDVVIVNQDLVFIGIGIRTNIQAAHFVEKLLKIQGFSEIIFIQTTYGCGHLDGVFNLINAKHAAIVPKRASYEIYSNLKRHGFSILDLNNKQEVDEGMSINFVPLNSETILINSLPREAIKSYESLGIECIQVDVSELMKGGGSVHCMTGVLRRKKH